MKLHSLAPSRWTAPRDLRDGIMSVTEPSGEQQRLRAVMGDETRQDEPVSKPAQLAMGILER